MKPVSLTPAMCLAGLLSGCVPAGGGPGGGGGFGASSAGPQSPQLEGWEIQELLADGSALIYWSGDGYADCIYFYPNGRFESDGYWVEYGEDFYFDGTYSGSWYVQGNQVCIDAACYYAG